MHFDPAVSLSDLLPRRCFLLFFVLFCFVFFFYCGHPRFWNFYSTIPVDVVRVKSYMNCLFDPKVGGSQKGYLLAMKRKKLIVRGNK